ncbi:6-hydroxy-d-nicotine oxidase [Trichoderma cornu-damae]|uniref:6-hydroxy-d-nicotine oxidase n=1 Tax=Trichoderma cornu-damae TaxID=654480 RepID=A0A9P8TZA7_9HYPO|nr:6-hydroxy-d-nicotine oxidase [Trichoderma cornu-damae]
MADSQLRGTSLLTCPFSIPDPKAPVSELLSRWSDYLVETPPAIIATPDTEEDVVSAVGFARLNKLTIIATSGRHGSALPIHSGTLYLDLKNLRAVRLDRQKAQAAVGGGALTGDVLRLLFQRGYFACLVNSNAVGVVGGLLGGGNSSMNGLLGWVADNVVSLRVVAASGDVVQLSSSSAGQELALFDALCGAGHGLCVVVSVTLRVYPLSSLNLSPASRDDPTPSIWGRTLVFPPPAIGSAVDAFLAFVPPPGPMNILLNFSRGLPGTPLAGEPIVLLTATYFGPVAEAESSPAGASLLRPSLVEKAIRADTVQIPFPNVNDYVEAVNARGGLKSIYAARIARLSPQAVKAVFAEYLAVTDRHPDASRTTLMFHSFNPSKLAEGKGKFVEARDRGFCALGISWSRESATREALAAFFDDATAILQKDDDEAGLAPRVFPATMKFLPGRRDLLSEERLAELDRVHAKWNGDGLFWSPYKAWE